MRLVIAIFYPASHVFDHNLYWGSMCTLYEQSSYLVMDSLLSELVMGYLILFY